MTEKIAVFTDSNLLFQTVESSMREHRTKLYRFDMGQYKEAQGLDIHMSILDLMGVKDSHKSSMELFHLKNHISKPILVCTDFENSRYLLHLFAFGVEDYIRDILDESEIEAKIINTLRYQRWLVSHDNGK